ncbi:hypothetical protein QR680_003773 [Steinernema hermaphroditum]|uniref:N-acetyltransferase domain-containing protein n=1 Tax=Steinernema hermaphroditum TaxID=289476 RepID=A0AA39HNR8_9BILA|nr:hypothetical protein QR680_003773 [Steinernema hermaphroditum]
MENVVIREATEADADGIVEFIVKNIVDLGPIDKTLGFNENDARDYYEAGLRSALQDGVSFVAIDTSRNEIVACIVWSIWHRDPKKNHPRRPATTPKAKILSSLIWLMRPLFWELCPAHINTVLKSEYMLVRKDFQRKQLAERFTIMSANPDWLKAKGVQGTVGVATSLANQRNLAKYDNVVLAEVNYADFFASQGIPFGGALTDGATKAVLVSTPFPDFYPKTVKVKAKSKM